MLFLLFIILAMGALAFWMWKRPDPVQRDQASTVQHDLWLENIDARLAFAARLLREGGQENYERAYQIYSELGKQYELPQAFSQMGLMHWQGQGREKNLQDALSLLEKSFKLGGEDAAYQLGLLNQDELHNTDQARYWFGQAAVLGHVDAQYRLNSLSPETAAGGQQHLALLQRNAAAGHAGSQYQLAQHELYQTSPPNISDGLDALFSAAAQQHLPANQQLYEFYRTGRFVPQDEQRALQFLKNSVLFGAQQLQPVYQQAVLMGKCDLDQRQRVLSELMAKSREQQDAEAKTLLGHAYFHGWHVEQNQTMAYRYWAEASHYKNAQALSALAALHFEQLLPDSSPEQAFQLYSQAEQAEPGYVSQMGLALCCIYAAGTDQDMAKAQALIQAAALQGWQYEVRSSADMYYALGLFYAMDRYPLLHKDKAAAFFKQAAEQGSADAEWALYRLYVSENQPQAAQFLARAAQAGHALAQYTLGQSLQQEDAALALQYLQQAAAQALPAAQNALGQLYEQGAAEDAASALPYYQQAAAGADADAYSSLGRMYLYGIGVERNIAAAKSWLEKGSRMQHAESMRLLQNVEDYLQV